MSLATLSGSLIVRLGALALDCLCCVLCNGGACQFNSDCSEGCSCVQGQCRDSCQSDEDCPEGYVCVNGACVPACQGEPCAETAECSLGCSCVDGQCWPNSDLYYCVRVGLDQRSCQRGRPDDENDIEGGPYLTYLECCEEGCGCKYDCSPASATGRECIARPAGFYENQSACEADCGEGEDVGACCETYPVVINGQVVRYERGPAANCPSTRAECQSEPPVYRSFRVSITDCSLCAITQFGACCTDEGCIDESLANPGSPIDPFECEQVLGGIFKDAWEDCTTHRYPTITAQFACDDCNGGFDCNCGMQEHCVNRVCVPCLDQVIEVPETAAPAWHDTGIQVAAGATVTLIAKKCDDLEWGTTIRSQVGAGLLQTGGPDDEYVADQAGNLQVRLERQGGPAAGQLCIAIVTPPPPPPPPGCCMQCIVFPAPGEPCPDGFSAPNGNEGFCEGFYDTSCDEAAQDAEAQRCVAAGGEIVGVVAQPCDNPLP